MKEKCNKKKVSLMGVFSFVLGAVSIISYNLGKNKYKYNKKCDEVIEVFYNGISKEVTTDNVKAFVKYINNKKTTTSELLIIRSIYEIINETNEYPAEAKDIKLIMEMNGYIKM